ncbi:DNA-3-methyladenine glycosylase 2 family protein [Rhodocytophaga aerolata]|uniref:DNA-3-methyladenine glycosylase II n=1 Tax=Rhodocytophaga aerolata TaxID=455078 RepID=A0ABT8R566_9BACT|nr:DNA-3-methyladenine glycosylase 2 family protein [Rhodocytophaga aerolata]MDO1447228.1 DNA-3-methyladenine glycosylase 2 family protein [Rhodocytophaga aerolata]
MSISWQHDPVIHRLTQVLPPPEPYPYQDTYLFLLDSVISQQLSTKVADVIYKRFLKLFPEGYPLPELLQEMPVEYLREVGLSTAKANYVKNIASFHREHSLYFEHLHSMPDEEILALLTQIKGVGPWTVQMVLMFPLNRPDVFPIDDLVIRQQISRWYSLTENGKELRRQMTAIAENWRPHRTLACKYLWKAKNLPATSI